MMNNMKKIFRILLIAVICITFFGNVIFARINTNNIAIGNSGIIESQFKYRIGRILTILQNISAVISVIALAIIGLKYMLSSVEEKADMKSVLIYYVVGAILIFATTTVLSVVYNITIELEKDTQQGGIVVPEGVPTYSI